LEKEIKDVKTTTQYDKIKSQFEENIAKTSAELDKLAPNLKAIDHFEDVKGRLATTQGDWNAKKKEAQSASERFEKKEARTNPKIPQGLQSCGKRD